MRIRKSALIVAIAALGIAGTGCRDQNPEKVEVFSGHHFLASDKAPTKSLGEDCTEGGQAECKDQGAVCFHYQSDPARGYVCSVPCASDADCPVDWTCMSMLPGVEGSRYCSPPPTWIGRVAVER